MLVNRVPRFANLEDLYQWYDKFADNLLMNTLGKIEARCDIIVHERIPRLQAYLNKLREFRKLLKEVEEYGY